MCNSELLPRRLFFDPPEKLLVRISPDGQWIAFQAPIDGVLNLWLAPSDEPENAQPLTTYADRKIGPALVWAHDNRHVLIFRDNAGDENWRIWSVDIETGEAIPLTPGNGVKAYVQETSRHYPSEILIAHNDRDRRFFDIYRVNIAAGTSSLVEENNGGFFGFFTDQQLQVRLARRYTDQGDVEISSRDAAGAWKPAAHIAAEDTLTTRPIEYSADGEELYWFDSRGRDKAAAVAENLKTGAVRLLAEDARADTNSMLLDPVTTRPIAVASMFDRTRWQVFDPEYREDFDSLAQRFPGEMVFNGMSDDRRKLIVGHLRDTYPLEYFCYDRSTRQARRLFSAQSRLEDVPLVPMEPVIVRARDGLELLCYLSRPAESKTGPVPMILAVHGGPWSRDVWGLSHQWLVNRGYAVLSVNFRGSTGFGKAFTNAANVEWGGKMQDDLIDAVDWVISEGVADPDRVAIVGGSYGGYAALVGLTFTPGKFACAVDLVGISNLVTFINAIPDYWRTWQSQWKVRMGDFTTEEGRRFLEERSPLNYVDRIAAVLEAFLAAHLGGRYEPVGDDFEGSSIQFKAGRELIPGI